MAITDYSTSASLNAAVSGISIAEGGAAANMNDAVRQIMADVAAYKYSISSIVNLKDRGAPGDGTGNSTTAINSAYGVLGGDGGSIDIPPGASYYPITTSPGAFGKPVTLRGYDRTGSEIGCQTASVTAITTTSIIRAENLNFTAFGSGLGSGTAILQNAGGGGSTARSGTQNCYIQGWARGLDYQMASAVLTFNTALEANTVSGLRLSNSNPDAGDNFTIASTFSSAGNANAIGIVIPKSSGHYLSSNKFLSEKGHLLVGSDIASDGTISATRNVLGDYLSSNNSFEGQVSFGAKYEADSTTASPNTESIITKIIHNGDQFSAAGATHIIYGYGSRNTITANCIFNDGAPSGGFGTAGLGVDYHASTYNHLQSGTAYHQILQAIKAPDASSLGLKLDETIFFAADVQIPFSGENINSGGIDGVLASSKHLRLARAGTSTSTGSWTTLFKARGSGMIEILSVAVVAGVATSGSVHRSSWVCGLNAGSAEVTAYGTAVNKPTGNEHDVQVAVSGADYLVQFKRKVGVAGNINVSLEAEFSGFFHYIEQI